MGLIQEPPVHSVWCLSQPLVGERNQLPDPQSTMPHERVHCRSKAGGRGVTIWWQGKTPDERSPCVVSERVESQRLESFGNRC